MPDEIRILGINGIPLLKKGDDIAKAILDAAEKQGTPVVEDDVLVVTQKIVSKVEGRVYRLSEIQPSILAKRLGRKLDKDPAIVELVLRESRAIVRMSGKHLITETRHGFICANSGVDVSNVSGGDAAALLPVDPDRSARDLREQIRRLSGKNVAVIVSDTFGRPFRIGHTDVAIGSAGIAPVLDLRGEQDLFGYVMKVKETAIIDELASAAELAIGNSNEAVPAAVIRGFKYAHSDEGARKLVMQRKNNLFR